MTASVGFMIVGAVRSSKRIIRTCNIAARTRPGCVDQQTAKAQSAGGVASKRCRADRKEPCPVSLLCLAIHGANPLAVLLVADLFEPVDIISAQRFLNGDMRVSRRATKATAMHSVPIIRRKSAQFSVALSRSHAEDLASIRSPWFA
jgi:hypothetical protein